MGQDENIKKRAWQLALRLERISADSIWARRASGYRGSLLKRLDQWDADRSDSEVKEFQRFLEAGYALLEKAARERLR